MIHMVSIEIKISHFPRFEEFQRLFFGFVTLRIIYLYLRSLVYCLLLGLYSFNIFEYMNFTPGFIGMLSYGTISLCY